MGDGEVVTGGATDTLCTGGVDVVVVCVVECPAFFEVVRRIGEVVTDGLDLGPVIDREVPSAFSAAVMDRSERQAMASPLASMVRPNLRGLRQAPTPVRPATDTARHAPITSARSSIVAEGRSIRPTPSDMPKSPVTMPTTVA